MGDKGGGKGGGAPSGPPAAPGCKLFVSNLPSDIQEDALKYVFSSYGTVAKVHIMAGKAKSGQSCAFVEYSNPQEAEVAIATLHEKYEIRTGEGSIIVKHAGGPRSSPY